MSYREPQDALRAELDLAQEELASARRDRMASDQKLARAEKALAAYRKNTGGPSADGVSAGRVIAVIGLALWLSAVVSALQDSDDLARSLAVAFSSFAVFAPLGVWIATQRWVVGVVFVVAKVVLPVVIAGFATVRAAARTADVDSLFWWAPVVLLGTLLVECNLLGRSPGHRP